MDAGTPLSDAVLGEALAFVRRANPFAEHTWGWDAGRFVDWRWGANAMREAASPGWFAAQGRVVRDAGAIRALGLSEDGGSGVCILTAAEDVDAVEWVLDVWATRRAEGVSLELASDAAWLRAVCLRRGMVEQPTTGHEWEYDLTHVSARSDVPPGFSVSTLQDEDVGRDGISACIRAAFGRDDDYEPVLRSLERNPMFRPELSVVARDRSGRVAAYCRGTVDAESGVCGIDPVCTHPDQQRRGLAAAVVRRCFAGLRAAGGRRCFIGSVAGPAPSTALYRSLGPVARVDLSRWHLPA